MGNLYQILGVRDLASQAEVKRAYRQLVKQYHPDLNPEPLAMEKIVEITNAYEILSDPIRKQTYDLMLYEPDAPPIQRAPSPEEQERRAYQQRHAQQEKERVERLYHLKTRFYRIQRASCFVFLLMGIVFTVDFFYKPSFESLTPGTVVLQKDSRERYITVLTTSYGRILETERGLYDHFDGLDETDLKLFYSSVFGLSSEVGVRYKGELLTYKVYGNLHQFENLFTYALLLISLIIIRQKQYTDWALTLAFLPFFIGLFLILSV